MYASSVNILCISEVRLTSSYPAALLKLIRPRQNNFNEIIFYTSSQTNKLIMHTSRCK